MMNLHLAEISILVAPGARAALVCDGAGWHQRGNAPIISSCFPGRPTAAQMLATGIPEDSVLAKVKKDGVLRIGFAQTAPWFFKDLKANALSGIYYDMCELLARLAAEPVRAKKAQLFVTGDSDAILMAKRNPSWAVLVDAEHPFDKRVATWVIRYGDPAWKAYLDMWATNARAGERVQTLYKDYMSRIRVARKRAVASARTAPVAGSTATP